MRRPFLLAAAAAAVILLGVALWLALRPTWAIAMLQAEAARIGRTVDVKGGAQLDLAPLAIRLSGVRLSGSSAGDDAVLTADALVIPIDFASLFTRRLDVAAARLERPDFAFIIDETGNANWTVPADWAGLTASITVQDGRLRFYDARNTQSLSASDMSAVLTGGGERGLALKGTAAVNGRLVSIDAVLKSLARVHADGSPLELAVEARDLSVSFSGRIATAKVLSLAGQISASGPDLREAARWMGALDASAPDGFGAFSADGVLDGVGRALAIRQAAISIGSFRGGGQMVLDFRGEVPKIQAELQAPTLMLDGFLPSSGRTGDGWGRADLGFKALRGFDAELNLETSALGYGPVTGIPARIAMTVKDGKLDAGIAMRTDEAGTATVTASIDGKASPPVLTLSAKGEQTDAGLLLRAMTGLDLLQGTGRLDLTLSGAGRTEEELLGTLKGSVSLGMTEGQIKGVELQTAVAALRDRIVDGWTALPGHTPVARLSGTATVADGIATLQDVTIAMPSATLGLSGEADLLRRGLDLKAEVRAPGEGGAMLLPVKAIIRGPWDGPRIYPDVAGLLEDPAAGFARLKAMPVPPAD